MARMSRGTAKPISSKEVSSKNVNDGWWVICDAQYPKDGCGAAGGWHKTQAEAVRAWNSRKLSAPSSDAVAIPEHYALGEDAAKTLRDWLTGPDGEITEVTIHVGKGHGGPGLYVSLSEYPEDGAVLLVNAPKPSAAPIEGNCPQCKGSGESKGMTSGHGPDDYEVDIPCPNCNGTGTVSAKEGKA